MNGESDCVKGSDEIKALKCNTETEFTCESTGRCLKRYRVNDNFPDCPDLSDENVSLFKCLNTEFDCLDGRCIPRLWVKNGNKDCKSGADENSTLTDCLYSEFQCLDKLRCLPRKYLCDGVVNCKDSSDEIELCDRPRFIRCTNSSSVSWFYIIWYESQLVYLSNTLGMGATISASMCENGYESLALLLIGFKCLVNYKTFAIDIQLKRTVPQYIVHQQGTSICANGEDLCVTGCSYCLDNMTIIATSQICDDVIDCPDMSDECTCATSDAEALCNTVYSQERATLTYQNSLSLICNGFSEMKDGIDEKYCSYDSLPTVVKVPVTEDSVSQPADQTFLCQSGAEAKRCDANFECHDKEDECSELCLSSWDDFSVLNTTTVIQHMETCFLFLNCTTRSNG